MIQPQPKGERKWLGSPAVLWLAVSARNAEAAASTREDLFCLRIFKAEARADIGMIDPPIKFTVLCNARGFSSQQIQLSSSNVDDQAIFLGHE